MDFNDFWPHWQNQSHHHYGVDIAGYLGLALHWMFYASNMVFLTPHSPEIWTCLLGRIMDHADLDSFQTPVAMIFHNQKTAWLLIMIWLWGGNLWSYVNPRHKKKKKKKSLSHKLITFLESTTVSHTMNLSMRKYWLTLNTKMTSYMFKESPGHSRTSLSFVLFPVSTNSICILWHPEFSNSRQPEPLFSPDCHILPSRRKVGESNSKDPSIFDLYGLCHWRRNRPCQWL